MSQEWTMVVLLTLAVGNYWVKRSVLYPPFLFCCIWLLGVGLDWLDLVETDYLHSNTLLLISMGAALFTAGGLLALLVPKSLIEARFILTRFPPKNELIKPVLILFLLCGVPMQIQSLRAMAAVGTGGTFLERARNGGIEAERNGTTIENQGPAFSIYFVFWTLFATILFMIERRDKWFWLVAVLALVSSILTTGRTSLLQMFAALTGIHLLNTGRTRFLAALKVARIPMFAFLFLYLGMVFVTKTDQSQFYASSAGEVAFVFFVMYIVGPLAAFDHFIQDPGNIAIVPNHTFKFYLSAAAHLHLINYQAAPILDEFTGVPYPVNVYTLYKDYIIDFGLTGAMISILIIGCLHVLLYRKAMTGSMVAVFLFALSLFPIAMSIFTDQYSALGNWTDALLFAGIYIILRSLPVRVLPRLQHGYGTTS